jgi:arylamine N-acetyltransferase
MRWTGEIPFENLDVVLGKQISIEPAVIESTLVLSGRGG